MHRRDLPDLDDLNQHLRLSDWYAVRAGLPRRLNKPIEESKTSPSGWSFFGFCLGALLTLLILGG